jgi:hypothetical protein
MLAVSEAIRYVEPKRMKVVCYLVYIISRWRAQALK